MPGLPPSSSVRPNLVGQFLIGRRVGQRPASRPSRPAGGGGRWRARPSFWYDQPPAWDHRRGQGAGQAGAPLKMTWGGQYRVLPNSSNFPFQPATISPSQPDQWFVNRAMRLWATVNPNDHVEGYIQFQVGGFNLGDNTEFPKTFVGPFSGPGDTLGIELRRGWMAYPDDDCGKVRVGILDWHDRFGDTMASSDYDFDVAGVTLPFSFTPIRQQQNGRNEPHLSYGPTCAESQIYTGRDSTRQYFAMNPTVPTTRCCPHRWSNFFGRAPIESPIKMLNLPLIVCSYCC